MGVFAGAWRRSGGTREPSIASLLAALDAPFHPILSAYDEGDLTLAARSLRQPAVVSHCGVVTALSGRLDDGAQVARVLDEYIDQKYAGLENLSGDYAVAVFDATRSTLILMRDPVGTQPLYYYASGDIVAFGSQIKAVLAAAGIAPRLNRSALAQLLVAGGGVPRGQTCFADIQSVMPGHALIVTRDNISGATHSELRPIVPTSLKTFEQSAAAFRRAMLDSVERRISPDANTAILTSGGVDSAAILCAAAAVADPQKILAISYGCNDGSSADERRQLKALLAATAVRSIRLDLAPIGFIENVEANVRAGETPVCDDVPGTLQRAANAARAGGADHLMIGTWGDQLLFPFPPPYLLELLLRGQVKDYVRIARSLPNWLADVPRSEVRIALAKQVMRALVPHRVLARIRPGTRDAAMYLDGLPASRRVRRREPALHVAALRREVSGPESVDAMEGTTKWGWSVGLETQLPYLDANLIQLLLAIPAEHALHDGVPKALLRKGMANLVPDVVLKRRDKGDYTEQIAAAFAAEQRACVDRLENGRRLIQHGFMSEAAAARTLALLNGRSEIGSGLLPTLVGLDAWLRVFFESPAGAQR